MTKRPSKSIALGIFMAVCLWAPKSEAQPLDVTIFEQGEDGQMAECSLSKVFGLKTGGDSFLAVRTGPGSNYRKFDELHNGDYVLVYDTSHFPWFGVLYGRGREVMNRDTGCGVVGEGKRPLPYKGKKGWIHSNWLEAIAG